MKVKIEPNLALCEDTRSRPEVPFSEAPGPKEPRTPINGKWCGTSTGSIIEIWDLPSPEGNDYGLTFRRPLDDGTQSVLSIGIRREAAFALASLLMEKLSEEPLDPHS